MERDVTSGILSVIVVFLGAPLLMGVINKTKAWVGGRRGPPLLQMYYDLAKLLRKGFVVSTTTSWVFLAGPVVAMSAAIVAAVLLPLAGRPAWISFTGDMILFVYVFGLARFFVASAAMDTGSAFEGMGAAREVTFSALAEPALFFGMLGLARISGSLSLSHMLDLQTSHAWQKASASIVLIIVSWFIVLLAENSRVPFDDPNTHLELTMIHEVMVLDHSGPDFGYIQYAAALKLWSLGALFVGLIVPLRSGSLWLDGGAALLGMAGLAVVIGIVESAMARYRLTRVPQFIVGAATLSVVAFIVLLV